jgi:ribose transport system substrate-binding protein
MSKLGLPNWAYRCLAVAPAILAVAVVASGVASGGTTNATRLRADGLQEAKRLVAQARAPSKWKTPGPTISVGSKVKGKTVYFLANGLNFPFVQEMLSGVKEALRVTGMKLMVGDGNGSSAKAGSLIQQAVSQKVDVIIDEGFPTSQLTAPVQAAKKAGIPVIEIGSGDPSMPPPSSSRIGVRALVTFCYSCAGREMARLAIVQSNGKVDAIVYDVPGISVAAVERDGIVSEFKRLCPSCKVKVVQAPLAQWTTLLPSLTSSSLRSDPNVNFLMPLFDAAIPMIKPAVIQVGASKRTKIISYNGSTPAITDLKSGNQLVSGIVGGPPQWLGWAMIDQAVRLLTGHPPVANENVPDRTFDPTNIGTINIKQSADKWYGPIDFRGNYKKLWGY